MVFAASKCQGLPGPRREERYARRHPRKARLPYSTTKDLAQGEIGGRVGGFVVFHEHAGIYVGPYDINPLSYGSSDIGFYKKTHDSCHTHAAKKMPVTVGQVHIPLQTGILIFKC